MERPEDPERQDTGTPDDAAGGEGASGGRAPEEAGPPGLQQVLEGDHRPTEKDATSSPLPEWLSFLHNRLILGGFGAVALLLLIAIVLVALGGGEEGDARTFTGFEETPEALATAAPGSDLVGRTKATVTLRNGPGLSYAILGTIPKGAVVSIAGRNEDATWLQVIYPPGSSLRGWVQASGIEVTGDVSELAIGRPGRGPSVSIPTSASPPVRPIEPTLVPPAKPTPARQPTPVPQPTPRPPTATPVPKPPTPTVAAPTPTWPSLPPTPTLPSP